MPRFYRLVGGLGRVLITAGVVVLLFVVYQLWGTGLREAQAQSKLTESFAETLAEAPAAPVEEPADVPLPPPEGEAVAIIRIPKIDVEKTVVEGVGIDDLQKGPGHYPDTPMPGQPGNAGIAGHRTTYGAPFYELDQLEVGDEILVRTLQGEFRYEVDRTSVVRPNQVEVLDPTEEARLTLTTCNPRFSAAQRLIVSAVLTGPPAPAPAPAPDLTPPLRGELATET
ncbi:MAG: class E sortase, partial [Actinomycetota bacterium]|nr:class E sortase [Actinomycetota bacterium]